MQWQKGGGREEKKGDWYIDIRKERGSGGWIERRRVNIKKNGIGNKWKDGEGREESELIAKERESVADELKEGRKRRMKE